MSSVSIETGEAPLLDSTGEISQSQMDPKFFKAAADGNVEPFKDMAREKIESLLTAKTRNTILHINIISKERENVSTEFVEEILEKCPSLLLQVNAKGDTPLHVAAKFGHSGIVTFLVERAKLPQHENEELESGVGAARQMIKMTNNEKNTALHEAVCHKNVDVVKILTKEDPDYRYSANNDGKTPLYMAAESRSSDMVLALLENSTSVSHEGPNGKTALHAAAMKFDLARSLINEGDAMGNTPLHVLAAVRRNEFYDVMIRNTQVNYDAVNKQNEEIQKLSKDVGGGQYSKGVIRIREPKDLAVQKYVTKENYKDTRASHLVVAALIATVAFAAAFTIPGGYRSENGTAILRRNTAFQAFIVADSIAMVFSLSAVFTHFCLSLLIEETKDFNEALFGASVWFTIFSMGAMVIAFVTGTYAMLVPSLGLAIITCLIGLSFFLLVILIIRLSITE
ncbi:ANK REP REGION domain-containing protein [Citrus sinensis]|uniref:ANK REP REGION domain-containing protein n=1 Tax=Citrus sinensis TaxID=2711 RepID=A0ACB8I2N0_CITSI|nr:ANK REP REGION domain-containing protein [Citrus sinensis]